MKKTALYIALGALSLAGLPSCNKFLDVQPKGTLLQEIQFSTLQGYYDAFYGVYGTMASSDLYGQRLTHGFVDELAQMFGSTSATSTSSKTRAYNYTDVSVQAEIYSLWFGQYKVISYVNNILANLESPSISSAHLSQLKGEALGLRAFLHFDLVRLFAEDYVRGKDSRGIPYSYEFNLKNRRVYTVAGTYENILKDLDEAERLLAPIDETVSLGVTQTADFWSGRAVHFNKYAVYATKARVYQAMGNWSKAAEYAKKVTDHTADFNLANRNSFESVRRFPASGEMIFGLYAPSFLDQVAARFLKDTGAGSDDLNEAHRKSVLDQLYAVTGSATGAIDNRQAAYYRDAGTYQQFVRFVASSEEATSAATSLRGLTLIRLPEMYYIQAEALYSTDPTAALAALNKVRESRGLNALTTSDLPTQVDFKAELVKEYMRELPGEGQIFSAFKHFNSSFLDLLGERTIEPSSSIFVLPWPQDELTYGNQ